MTTRKTAAERWEYYKRKAVEYGARLRDDRNYDVWDLRRNRLASYRNHTFKLANLEAMRDLRRKYGRGGRR